MGCLESVNSNLKFKSNGLSWKCESRPLELSPMVRSVNHA